MGLIYFFIYFSCFLLFIFHIACTRLFCTPLFAGLFTDLLEKKKKKKKKVKKKKKKKKIIFINIKTTILLTSPKTNLLFCYWCAPFFPENYKNYFIDMLQ